MSSSTLSNQRLLTALKTLGLVLNFTQDEFWYWDSTTNLPVKAELSTQKISNIFTPEMLRLAEKVDQGVITDVAFTHFSSSTVDKYRMDYRQDGVQYTHKMEWHGGSPPPRVRFYTDLLEEVEDHDADLRNKPRSIFLDYEPEPEEPYIFFWEGGSVDPGLYLISNFDPANIKIIHGGYSWSDIRLCSRHPDGFNLELVPVCVFGSYVGIWDNTAASLKSVLDRDQKYLIVTDDDSYDRAAELMDKLSR